jgi:hypothetical protein
MVLAWEAESTPASLSGWDLGFLLEMHRALIIARQENTPTISAMKFSECVNELQFLGA